MKRAHDARDKRHSFRPEYPRRSTPRDQEQAANDCTWGGAANPLPPILIYIQAKAIFLLLLLLPHDLPSPLLASLHLLRSPHPNTLSQFEEHGRVKSIAYSPSLTPTARPNRRLPDLGLSSTTWSRSRELAHELRHHRIEREAL